MSIKSVQLTETGTTTKRPITALSLLRSDIISAEERHKKKSDERKLLLDSETNDETNNLIEQLDKALIIQNELIEDITQLNKEIALLEFRIKSFKHLESLFKDIALCRSNDFQILLNEFNPKSSDDDKRQKMMEFMFSSNEGVVFEKKFTDALLRHNIFHLVLAGSITLSFIGLLALCMVFSAVLDILGPALIIMVIATGIGVGLFYFFGRMSHRAELDGWFKNTGNEKYAKECIAPGNEKDEIECLAPGSHKL